jgi:hypothetical protein
MADNPTTSEDIIERLLYVAEWGSTDPCKLCIDAANEIERLRATLREIRRDIEESADDVVWMRGGIETVCDRITAALGDQHVPE